MIEIKRAVVLLILLMNVGTSGCELPGRTVKEMPDSFRLLSGTTLKVNLRSELGSNSSNKGDMFSALLSEPLMFGGRVVLPRDTEFKGQVKDVDRFERFGDRAGLSLIFEQMIPPDGSPIPIKASLDTKRGAQVISVKGEALKNTRIMAHSTLAGSLVGDALIETQGAEKGLAIGAGLGSSAIFLSGAKEVSLPVGTELIIKLDEVVVIPK